MFASAIALGLKIFPLYISVALGYIAVKKLNTSRDAIAPLIVYILAPAIVFSSALQVRIDTSTLLVPFVIFVIATTFCFAAFFIGGKIWKDKTKNLVAFSAGTGNTGYFGIPLAFLLLSKDTANIYVFALVVSFLYEYTVGFYIISRSTYTFSQSIIKLAKLPMIYAAILGFALNICGVKIGDILIGYLDSCRGAYSILGMMMIGMGLVGVKNANIDKKFVGMVLGVKFIVWPAVVIFLAAIDRNFFGILNESAYQVMFVYSIVPVAANTVIMATLFNVKPEQASLTILIGTLLAFVTIPIMATLFL